MKKRKLKKKNLIIFILIILFIAIFLSSVINKNDKKLSNKVSNKEIVEKKDKKKSKKTSNKEETNKLENTDANTNNTAVNEDTQKSTVTNANPYYIKVIRNQNVVLVYGLDSNGNYTNLVKNYTVSVGKDNGTPTGTFKTSDKYAWRALYGGVYGQYATRITEHILFHSVPYKSMSKDSLEYDEYNKLGEAASLGCIRMRIEDLKWIYDNCPRRTTVEIYDGNLPNGVNKKVYDKIDTNSPNRGWDPTDPDPNNPWKRS